MRVLVLAGQCLAGRGCAAGLGLTPEKLLEFEPKFGTDSEPFDVSIPVEPTND